MRRYPAGNPTQREARAFFRRLARRCALVAALYVVLPPVADFVAGSAPAQADCPVVQVVDGDTVDFRCPERGLVRVRLDGFDAPELFSPGCVSEAGAAVAAQWYLRRTLWGADRVELRFGGGDRYGRAVAAVRIDGEDLARRMIAAGHGRAYSGGRRGGWCA
jgi:endonuclease YncB( thermonuclease family)